MINIYTNTPSYEVISITTQLDRMQEHHITRCTRGVRVFFSAQERDTLTVHVVVCINLTLLLRTSGNAHMTVFGIVVHHNVDNWIQSLTLYILAHNSSIDCHLIHILIALM